MLTAFDIPPDLEFPDLRLARDDRGALTFDDAPLRRICTASGVDSMLVLEAPVEKLVEIILAWYVLHCGEGGAPDPIAEELLDEMIAEADFREM